MTWLNSKREGELACRIHELEQLHDLGDHTPTDTFELDELRAIWDTALRVIEGGQSKARANRIYNRLTKGAK